MAVTFQHPGGKPLPVGEGRGRLRGEDEVKRRRSCLPRPNPSDTSRDADARYEQYKVRRFITQRAAPCKVWSDAPDNPPTLTVFPGNRLRLRQISTGRGSASTSNRSRRCQKS